MDGSVCFTPGGLTLMATVGTILQGAIVTLFWLLIRAKDAQVAKAEAREAEWRRVAVRGADEIIPSLAVEVRPQLRQLMRELRGEVGDTS